MKFCLLEMSTGTPQTWSDPTTRSNFDSYGPDRKSYGPFPEPPNHQFASLPNQPGVPRCWNSPMVLFRESLPEPCDPHYRIMPLMINIGHVDDQLIAMPLGGQKNEHCQDPSSSGMRRRTPRSHTPPGETDCKALRDSEALFKPHYQL